MPTWRVSARTVGRNAARLRKVRDLTQDDVVDRLKDKSVENYSKFERGIRNVKLSTLQQIADALNAPLSALFEGTRGP